MEHFLASGWGYAALVLLTFAEASCVPIPSEVTLGYAGYLVSTGRFALALVIVLGTAGELVGALVGYAIGRVGGRPLVDRLGRYVLLTKRDLDRAERWFARRGEPAVLLGRILPVVRTFVSLPAGFAEMRVGRFALFTGIGSLLWCSALAATGDALGRSWQQITKGFTDAGYVLVAVAVLAVASFLLHRLAGVRRERAEVAARAVIADEPRNPTAG